MVREAARADPRFEVSTLELERPGPSYTVDTLRALHAADPDAELYLIMGVDQYKELDSWHDPERLLTYARLAVMDREGESAREASVDVPGARDAVFVPVQRVDVSSTAVREAVREGRDASAMLPPGVAAIIAREGLYSETS
jgi:nicotinate-nucleotide adenylyltransferase